tara:strand:+ start:55 stop:318 length:264 start_codon:yes stop_codon:yes gene_type:complete
MKYKYDDTYDIVVSMAKTKMLMNAHKGDIEKVPTDVLVLKAKEELDELLEAINVGSDYVHVVEEVADILNFAVAAAYNAINNYRERK